MQQKPAYKFLKGFANSLNDESAYSSFVNEDPAEEFENDLNLIGNDGYEILNSFMAKHTDDIWEYRIRVINTLYKQISEECQDYYQPWEETFAWDLDRLSHIGFEYIFTHPVPGSEEITIHVFKRKAMRMVLDIPVKNLEDNEPVIITQEMRDKFKTLKENKEAFVRLPSDEEDIPF
jgi:hypothetical protein